MKTYSQKPDQITRKWYVIDATDVPMGRLSTVAASLLIGKGKPTVTSHMDGGDYVVVINSDSLKFTGSKLDTKEYHNHSGFPGGLRTRKLSDLSTTEALQKSIRGMLPVNKLRDGRLARLKIYAGSEHNHTAQQPKVYPIKKSETK